MAAPAVIHTMGRNASPGPDLGIASADLLMRELANLEHADGAFVEIENFRHQRRRVSWHGELRLSDQDKVRALALPDLLARTRRFIEEGIDGRGVPASPWIDAAAPTERVTGMSGTGAALALVKVGSPVPVPMGVGSSPSAPT